MSSLRLIGGSVDDLRAKGSLQPTWAVPARTVRRCVACKRVRPLRVFQQKNGAWTRRCNTCIHQAKRSPGGLLGYRNL